MTVTEMKTVISEQQLGLAFVLCMLMIIALAKTLLPDYIVGITVVCGSLAVAALACVIFSTEEIQPVSQKK